MSDGIEEVERPAWKYERLVDAIVATAVTGKAVAIDPAACGLTDVAVGRHRLQPLVNARGYRLHCRETETGRMVLWAEKRGKAWEEATSDEAGE